MFQYTSSPEDGYKTIRDMFANPVKANDCVIAATAIISSALTMFMFHLYGRDTCLCLYQPAGVRNHDTAHFALKIHSHSHFACWILSTLHIPPLVPQGPNFSVMVRR